MCYLFIYFLPPFSCFVFFFSFTQTSCILVFGSMNGVCRTCRVCLCYVQQNEEALFTVKFSIAAHKCLTFLS